MPIAVAIDKVTGLPKCLCCRLGLYHCKKCWTQFHNSHKGKDYIAPEYYGQPFFKEETYESLEKQSGIKHEFKIKPNKNRKYKEGDYH